MEPQTPSQHPAAAPVSGAWQPLTFGGVAAFAGASARRLVGVQTAVALLVALSVVWFLTRGWGPVLTEALGRLPNTGAIRGGELLWPAPSPAKLAEAKFLSLVVDLDGTTPLDHTSDVQVEFRRRGLRLHSLLGYWAVSYPAQWTWAFNRIELQSWLETWAGVLLAAVGLGVGVGLLFGWALLAIVWTVPVLLVARFLDRRAGLLACWRVAAAAQMPGALLMTAALGLYTEYRISLVGLLFAWLLHWGVTGLYLVGGAVCLPRLQIQTPSVSHRVAGGGRRQE
jgi:hypothetical protein